MGRAQDLFCAPQSVEDASAALMRAGAVALAGGTWVMRAPLRGEAPGAFVSLGRVAELHGIAQTPDALRIGAMVSHDALTTVEMAEMAEMRALRQAAGRSANPAIRRAATVGGNICTQGFAAPDLVPALLALGAGLELCAGDVRSQMTLEAYIADRVMRPAGEIVVAVNIPRQAGRSAHARALLRQAGDYPVANLSVFATLDAGGRIDAVRVAVGAVEAAPRRWAALEAAVQGQALAALDAGALAAAHLDTWTPRDAVDAPGSYRLRLLPRLAGQAFADLAAQFEGGA